VESALESVTGFEPVYKTLQQKLSLKEVQSKTIIENYIRRIAQTTLLQIQIEV
jgi:hypothetical protein